MTSPPESSNVRGLLGVALAAVSLLLPLALGSRSPAAEAADAASRLKDPSVFAAIEDESERSMALFVEAGKVLLHPRCVNCHPAGDRPLQGEAGALHQPRVERGEHGEGVVGMRCGTCHHTANFDPGRVPGAPNWHLAPREMAWEGLSLGEICAQLKDPLRNGGRDLEQIVHHMGHDALVGWGWEPGADREPAPGTQAAFAALIRAWADSGAVCPRPAASSRR